MKHLAIFVHYNKKHSLKKHVLYSLINISQQYDQIVVISNSKLSRRNSAILKKHCDVLLFRENKGYDFAAWRDGLKHIGWSSLEKFETITLVNDTTYFPLFPLNEIVSKFNGNKNIDFWGASIHGNTTFGMPGSNGPVNEHVQSYFMCFKVDVVNSKVFRDFWDNVRDASNVKDVINEYETKLTSKLSKAGFRYNAIYNPKDYNDRKLTDAVYEIPEKLIARKFPFLKQKVVNKSNRKKLLRTLSSKNSVYPQEYITNYIKDSVFKKATRLSKRIIQKLFG